MAENHTTQEDEAILDNDEEILEDEDESSDQDGAGTDDSEESDEGADDQEELTTEQKLAKETSRANKLQRLLKKAKGNGTKPKPAVQSETSGANIEETVLRAQGMDEDVLKELKVVAKARGISSLIAAQKDPLFIAAKEILEKDKKSKDAAMNASRGSGSRGNKPAKTAATPGLTEDEHKKMWKDARA